MRYYWLKVPGNLLVEYQDPIPISQNNKWIRITMVLKQEFKEWANDNTPDWGFAGVGTEHWIKFMAEEHAALAKLTWGLL